MVSFDTIFNTVIIPYGIIVNGDYMKFQRLYDLRIDNDKTQKDIADYLMCNRQVYARYERGLREIPVSMVIKLAKYYKTSTDYILGLTDNPTAYK